MGEQETPLHWSTMFAWLAWIIGRAHQRYRTGSTRDEAIEAALETANVVTPIDIAARVVWRMMVDPVTDPTLHRIWLDAFKTLEEVER